MTDEYIRLNQKADILKNLVSEGEIR